MTNLPITSRNKILDITNLSRIHIVTLMLCSIGCATRPAKTATSQLQPELRRPESGGVLIGAQQQVPKQGTPLRWCCYRGYSLDESGVEVEHARELSGTTEYLIKYELETVNIRKWSSSVVTIGSREQCSCTRDCSLHTWRKALTDSNVSGTWKTSRVLNL